MFRDKRSSFTLTEADMSVLEKLHGATKQSHSFVISMALQHLAMYLPSTGKERERFLQLLLLEAKSPSQGILEVKNET